MQEELKALEEEADKLLQAQEIQSPSEAAQEESTEEERQESDARYVFFSDAAFVQFGAPVTVACAGRRTCRI